MNFEPMFIAFFEGNQVAWNHNCQSCYCQAMRKKPMPKRIENKQGCEVVDEHQIKIIEANFFVLIRSFVGKQYISTQKK